MNYQKIYDTLINRAKDRIYAGYTEKHHIIPRCMGGNDEKTNLVKLTPEEHYVAHQLLIKIYNGNLKLVAAAQMMVVNRPSNKLYGWLRRRYSKAQKINQTGENNSQFGKVWINKDGIPKCIHKDVLTEFVTNGWSIGRTVKKLKVNKLKVKNVDIVKILKSKHYNIKRSKSYREAKTKRLYRELIDSGLSLGKFASFKKLNKMTLSKMFSEFVPEYKPKHGVAFNKTEKES